MIGPCSTQLPEKAGTLGISWFLRAAFTEQRSQETLGGSGPAESGGLGLHTELTKSPPATSSPLQPSSRQRQTAACALRKDADSVAKTDSFIPHSFPQATWMHEGHCGSWCSLMKGTLIPYIPESEHRMGMCTKDHMLQLLP